MVKYIIMHSLVFSLSLIGELIDLGTYGSTHSIKEKNFMDLVEEKAKDLNTTLLKQQLKISESIFLKVKKIIPTCKKTQTRDYIPTFIVATDVVLPNGTVIARAGQVMNTLEVMKKNHIKIDKYMIFIDASNDIEVQLSYMYKNQGQVYIINGSIKKYEKYTNILTFKADKNIVERFGVRCSPSLVIQDNDKLVIYEYNPKELVKEEEE